MYGIDGFVLGNHSSLGQFFTKEMIAHYEDTRRNTFFRQLINLKKKGSVTKHIENFQRLNIKVTNIPDEHLIDVFIGTLKNNIQHEVHLWEQIIGECI